MNGSINNVVVGFSVLAMCLGLSQAGASVPQNVQPHSNLIVAKEIQEVQNPYSRKYGVTLGVQFPTGAVLEFNYRLSPHFSFGIDSGGLFLDRLLLDNGRKQRGVTNSIGMIAFEGRGRWHPSGDGFFLGLAAGWQNLTVTGLNGDPSAAASIRGSYTTPHLGWLWVMNSGVSLGSEIGVQIPFFRTMTTFGMTTQDRDSAHSGMARYGTAVLPYINFIKFGYSF